MSEIFLALDKEGHEVVVKTLSSQLLKKRFVEMFLREVEVSKSVQHKNVVRYLDSGMHEETPFLVLEYLQGMTVRDLAKRHWSQGKVLSPKLVGHVVAKAAEGLSSIHALRSEEGDLVHRDISPDNLFVTFEGHVKVLDLGISRGAFATEFTKTGELKGKVPFMSPEQVDGRPLDGRSDLFSLGVSAYWLLARQRPFRGSSDVHVLNAILDAPAPPLAKSLKIPAPIRQALFALLEKRPEDRPENAARVAEIWANFGEERLLLDAVLAAKDIVIDPRDQSATGPSTKRLLPSHRPSMTRQSDERLWPILVASAALLLLVIAVILGSQKKTPAKPLAKMPQTVVNVIPPKASEKPDAGPSTPDVRVADAGVDLKIPKPPPSRDKKTPKAKPLKVLVNLKGPTSIDWRAEGKALGRGAQKVKLSKTLTHLTAHDATSGLKSRVPIVEGSADYSLLPTGSFSVRAIPFARVKVGTRWLGVTPVLPQKSKVGEIEVTLVYEGQAHKERIRILPGQDTRLDHRFGEN